MSRALCCLVLLAGLSAAPLRGEETNDSPREEKVAVAGSSTTFQAQVESLVAERKQTLHLTGTALRSKARFRLYAIASYCDNLHGIESPEHLAAVDRPKQLHLVMERRLPTRLVARSIESAIDANHPDQFKPQLKRALEYLSQHSMTSGTHVRFTHLPGVGVEFRVNDEQSLIVDDVKFSHAVWNAYFGKHNLGESIKRSLTSRIPATVAASE